MHITVFIFLLFQKLYAVIATNELWKNCRQKQNWRQVWIKKKIFFLVCFRISSSILQLCCSALQMHYKNKIYNFQFVQWSCDAQKTHNFNFFFYTLHDAAYKTTFHIDYYDLMMIFFFINYLSVLLSLAISTRICSAQLYKSVRQRHTHTHCNVLHSQSSRDWDF